MSDESWRNLGHSVIIEKCPYFSEQLDRLKDLPDVLVSWKKVLSEELAKKYHQHPVNHWWNELTPEDKATILLYDKKVIELEIDGLRTRLDLHNTAIKQLREENRYWYINQPRVPT